MSAQRISFQVDTSRVLALLAKQIYQSPLALLRENTQNAFDAVLLRLQVEPTYPARIDIEVTSSRIVVRDNGIGMTPEDLVEHFWQAGSSSKNTAEARRAGVVGTFGIGAMANFGIADLLEVTTESAKTGQRTRCVARREELRFNQDCIDTETLEPTGSPGTEIIASIAEGTAVDPVAAKLYVAEFVALLDIDVYVNSELMSRQPIVKLVSPVAPQWETSLSKERISQRLIADVDLGISQNADIGVSLTNLLWNGISLAGKLILKSGIPTLRTFRTGFGLATVSVGSVYQFGGVADLEGFQPTAGREALTTDSMQLLQSIITDVDAYATTVLATRPEADSSTPFMNWIASHARYDLCGKLKISISPGDRTALEDIRARTINAPMPLYDGSDQSVIKNFSSEDAPLLILARSNPRRQCEIKYVNAYCKTIAISNAPFLEAGLERKEWGVDKNALAYRIQAILEDDYFFPAEVGYGKISHGLSLLVDASKSPATVNLDSFGTSVLTMLALFNNEYNAFGSMVKDFVRNSIFPKISDKVPSSTRQGADAFLRAIRKPREVFEYADADTSNLATIWGDYSEGRISLTEAVDRSKVAVRNSVQIVESSSAARMEDVIPDVIQNEQATHDTEDEGSSFDALPAITRVEQESAAKLLTIENAQPALRGYRCFLALTDKVRSDMGDFFLQPHKTSIVWGGQKVLFIFLHHSGEFGLYYDLQTRDTISGKSGGGSFQTCTMILKNTIYIPVPEEISQSFIPVAGERKRFEVRCDLLRVEG